MNPKKNKTLIGIVVAILVLGLVMTYAPLLFNSPDQVSAPQSASVAPIEEARPTEDKIVSSTEPKEEPKKESLPSGFSDFGNEQQSLDDVNNLLGQ